MVCMGSLRRLNPISKIFGLDRGIPIDRYYIEAFLNKNKDDIKGSVFEIGDATYSKKYGNNQIEKLDVLHAVPGNPQATLIGDLSTGEGVPKEVYHCMIIIQTYLVIYEVKKAIINTYNALAPGGVLLATFPGISQISRYDMDRWGDFWRFTDASARKLFGEVFGEKNIKVETYGNVLAACAFLHGLSAKELKSKELDYHDQDYQVIITVRALKSKA